MRALAADLLASLGLFTRLPLSWLERWAGPVDLRRSIRLWPLVGAGIGALTALIMQLALMAGLPPLVSALLAVSAQLIVTGALHEDGLADSADGLAAGRTLARRLEIMRDSRIGSYGAAALIMALALRTGCIAALPSAHLLAYLTVAGACARASVLIIAGWTSAARQDGLAAALLPLPVGPLRLALLTLLLLTAFLLPDRVMVMSLLASMGATLVVRRIALRAMGGFTGDLLGATAVLSELAVLLVLVATYAQR
ncbi:adenosylcobinamide-GDP ribazoletransferase [Acetobacter estunensis]|uniref:adenosylcobinamide-GDP ribazoletransferase n=1 Tax=Acetobacter estunensis TaxID=104097 RepID=UPI001C2D31A9|nr:adenosylcobinamide-GDP ribazoletransferase [Acetobacter estunensis]MBV1836176.1 adenosylcobinamide-GDP ribazoletransferase [Acetobacter estunensis]